MSLVVLPGILQRFQRGQAQQQAVQLQYGGGVREAVGARGVLVGLLQLGELGGPAGAARAVVRGLCADQGRGEPDMGVVQFASHDPYDVGGLPAAPPGLGHELGAAPGQFRVRGGVGGEQGGTGVQRGVVLRVEGGLEGAVDDAGRVAGTVAARAARRAVVPVAALAAARVPAFAAAPAAHRAIVSLHENRSPTWRS
ncbi:hypothetical protein RKD27_004216 [Streptomyces sp. SAI-126]